MTQTYRAEEAFSEAHDTIRRLTAERDAALAEAAAMREALEPFARLKVPHKPQGNAGAYSILHDDIKRAQDALTFPRSSTLKALEEKP